LIVVRYADDTIVGFEHQDDAETFLEEVGSPGRARHKAVFQMASESLT
jgi:hypothetical protein